MFERNTEKLYYQDRYLASCTATIVKIGADHIELDRTVAFPEGGGQEADTGVIGRYRNGVKVRFVGARKVYATPIQLEGMPEVSIGGVVWHAIHPDDQALLAQFEVGDAVVLQIDALRRERLSVSHTASHLLYLGVQRYRPEAVDNTLGCHISEHGARFDFGVGSRFESDEIEQIACYANGLVAEEAAVEVFHHQAYLDARFWRCGEAVIPCGGTHLDSTGIVGELRLKRRSMGTGKERLACEFPNAKIDLSRYHLESGTPSEMIYVCK